jgi:antitoxin ParD1/3/4
MHTLTIAVPDKVKRFIEAEVDAGHFGDSGQLISHLVSEEEKRRAHARVEALLKEGLNSPASEFKRADWDRLKQRALERDRERNGQP